MDEKIRKALDLAKEGFDDGLIETILDNPELEASIRKQMARAAVEVPKNKLKKQLEEVNAELVELEKRADKSDVLWARQIGLKRMAFDLQSKIAMEE